VRRRDKTCRLAYGGCTGTIEEFDHIVNLASIGADRGVKVTDAQVLQGVCRHCHAIKSEAERLEGLKRFHAKRFRPAEPHPGLIDTDTTMTANTVHGIDSVQTGGTTPTVNPLLAPPRSERLSSPPHA
jgi:hypothetical protein